MRFQPGPCTLVHAKDHELDWPEFTATKTIDTDGTITINTPVAVRVPIVVPRARTASTGHLVTNVEVDITTRPLATDPSDDSGVILVADNNDGRQLFYDPEDDTWWVTTQAEHHQCWRLAWLDTVDGGVDVLAPGRYDDETATEIADLTLEVKETDLPPALFTAAPLKQESCRYSRTETKVATCGEQLTAFINDQLQNKCNNRRIIGNTIADRCHTPQVRVTNNERYLFPYADTDTDRLPTERALSFDYSEHTLATLRLDDPQLPWPIHRPDLLTGNTRNTVAADLMDQAKNNIAQIEHCLTTPTVERRYAQEKAAENHFEQATIYSNLSHLVTNPHRPRFE